MQVQYLVLVLVLVVGGWVGGKRVIRYSGWGFPGGWDIGMVRCPEVR